MKIALSGSLYSGKTSLARYLSKHHGFWVMNYTDSLKVLGVRTLRAAGIEVTLQEMLHNKARYRPFLQELGTAVGFDQGYGVEQCIDEWFEAGSPENVVFDNVRFVSQFEKLLPYGFVLVGLAISDDVYIERARAKGLTPNEAMARRKHYAEQGVTPDVWLDASRKSPEQLAEVLFRLAGKPVDLITPELTEVRTERGDVRYLLPN